MAPLRMLSVDIETLIPPSLGEFDFPKPESEAVIQIASVFSTYGQSMRFPIVRADY